MQAMTQAEIAKLFENAPDGCTHYVVGSMAPYEKRDGDQWYYWSPGRREWAGIFQRGDARLLEGPFAIVSRELSAPQWNGEGLPPVGVVCEFSPRLVGTWNKAKILYIGQRYVIVDEDGVDTSEQCYFVGTSKFRPIRTPEQIAAQERESAVAKMKECFDSISDDLMPTSNKYLETLFGALHDAGLRFPKGGEK